MVQPVRLTIGFDTDSANRLRSLTTKLNASQRDVICALLALDEAVIARQVTKYKTDEETGKKAIKAKLLAENKRKREEARELARKLDKHDPKERAKILEILK